MLKIGDFSKLSLTTIKALRYYEKENLLKPSYIDSLTNYRYYEMNQLQIIAKIKSLRDIGFSIKEIKEICNGKDFRTALLSKESELENKAINIRNQLKTINYLLEEKNMNYEAVVKKLPKCIVYYEEKVIEDFSKIQDLVFESANECIKLNPSIECVKPDYCFIEYLDGEYKEKNILARYSQAVTRKGIENNLIHFKELDEVYAICVYHKGDYSKLPDAYSFILNYAKKNGYKAKDFMREVYIDGAWNKDNTEEYLTEIQMPIEKID